MGSESASARGLRRGLLLASWLAAATAMAGPAELSAADRETARNLMDIGRQKEASGDFQAALQAYQGADRIVAAPTTGLAVGEALIGLGRLVEARDKLLVVTRIPAAADDPAPFVAARHRARRLSVELASRIPSLQIEVLTTSSDEPTTEATVRIDGETLSARDVRLPRKLDPGTHTVVAFAPGLGTARKTIELAEQEHQWVTLVLRDERPSTAVSIGSVSPLVWIGYGFTVAGAIVGAAAGSAALAKDSVLAADCPDGHCPADEQDTIDSMQLWSHVSTVGFAVAAAGAIVGTVGVALSLDGSSSDDDLATLQPVVGPRFVGLRGSF